MTQQVRLKGSWKISRLTSAPASLTFLLPRSLSETITFPKQMHLLSNNEIGAVGGKYIISLRLFRILKIIYDLHFHTQETQRSQGTELFLPFSASTTETDRKYYRQYVPLAIVDRFLFIYVGQ